MNENYNVFPSDLEEEGDFGWPNYPLSMDEIHQLCIEMDEKYGERENIPFQVADYCFAD